MKKLLLLLFAMQVLFGLSNKQVTSMNTDGVFILSTLIMAYTKKTKLSKLFTLKEEKNKYKTKNKCDPNKLSAIRKQIIKFSLLNCDKSLVIVHEYFLSENRQQSVIKEIQAKSSNISFKKPLIIATLAIDCFDYFYLIYKKS